ncbi:unnamed protein product, partial [Polarella glacialis]
MAIGAPPHSPLRLGLWESPPAASHWKSEAAAGPGSFGFRQQTACWLTQQRGVNQLLSSRRSQEAEPLAAGKPLLALAAAALGWRRAAARVSGRRRKPWGSVMRGSGGQAASTPEPGDEDNEAVDRRSEESVAQQVLLSGLRLYRTYVSPLLPPNCRFVPSCSRYGIESVKRYGAWEGLLLFIWRVLRCSPLAPVDKSKIVWANNRFCVADDPEIWHSKLFAPGSSGSGSGSGPEKAADSPNATDDESSAQQSNSS